MTSSSSGRGKKSGRSWGVIAFGSIFLAVGLLVAGITAGKPFVLYLESQGWDSVPVTITRLELIPKYDEDSVTWRVEASYQYFVDGNTYYNNSVSLSSGSDNIGNYWQLLYSRLNTDKQRQQAYAYVNPDDPQRAYLDRSLRPEMMLFGGVFALVFMLAGGGVMYLGWRPSNNADDIEHARSGIASDQRGGYKILLVFGILFILISLPAVVTVADALSDGQWSALLAFLFPLVGGVILFFALRMRKRYLQIGPTPLFPDPLPGYAGGQVGGCFHLTRGEWIKPPQVRLTCTHSYSTGSGKERRTQHDVIWQSKGRAYTEPKNSGCDVHALFDVPADVPGSGSQPGYHGLIQWSLHCTGTISLPVSASYNPRVDNSRAMRSHNRQTVEFERSWSLPVEKGQRASSFQIPSEVQQAWHQQQREEARESAAAQINLATQGESLHLSSQRGRHARMALGMVLFGGIFDGAAVFLLHKASQGEAMLWLMGGVFLLAGLLITGFGLFWLGRGLQADVSAGHVRMVRRLFGVTLYQRNGTVTSPSQVQLSVGLSSTDQHGVRTEYYTLLVNADGKKIKLAEGIEGREAAEALKEQVMSVITRQLDDELV
ncbi:MAG: DUF3592 domain-containing protein [Saccharospirillaceae bacterium]|nr:DUF3592 domain-containing protein [Saccharospirillaceae bacterium]MCD8530017.1 DUF3592 domain-containing protein [Saccharospirillaceae bacterium]